MIGGLSPEQRLVIIGSHTVCSLEEKTLITELSDQCTDAANVVRIALVQKTFPLFYHNLSHCARKQQGLFSREVEHDLRKAALQHWVPALHRIRASIQSITALFHAEGIDHAFLRGVPFAERFYGQAQFRYCEDIDLLVPDVARHDAAQALLGAGYEFVEPEAVREARAEFVGQIEFIHRSTNSCLDLNWKMTGNAGIGSVTFNMAEVWHRARRVSKCLVELSTSDVLLDAARHCTHGHDFVGSFLRSCSDLERIFSVGWHEIDWTYVKRQLAASECLNAFSMLVRVYNGFSVLRNAQPVCIPMLSKNVEDAESFSFSRVIVIPFIGGQSSGALQESAGRYAACISKFWTLDRYSRFLRISRMLAFPTKHERCLLLRTFGHMSRPRFSTMLCLLLIAAMIPAIFGGMLIHIFFSLADLSRQGKKWLYGCGPSLIEDREDPL